MTKILPLLKTAFVVVPFFCFADEKGFRHYDAHVHGGATLAVAFDHFSGKIEFRAAAESLLGFEHQPRTAKEKAMVTEVVAKFENEISTMVQFDSNLGCVFVKDEVKQEYKNQKKSVVKGHAKHQGEHSDFIANFKVECKKTPKGTQVKLDFSNFTRINNLEVTLLVDDLQKNLEVKKTALTVELK